MFSLRERRTVDDDGVTFAVAPRRLPAAADAGGGDGDPGALGSDIAMAFDECPPSDAPRRGRSSAAMARTTRWARRCVGGRRAAPGQLRFGIVQGGVTSTCGARTWPSFAELPFDGLALGGLGVGEPPEVMHAVIAAVAAEMPADRPALPDGRGDARGHLARIGAGIDMFDCVMPTRNARNGQLFMRAGRLNIANAATATSRSPVEDGLPLRVLRAATAAPTWRTSFTPRSCSITAWRRSTTCSTT